MSKIIKRILILSCLIAILILPYFVFASDVLDRMKTVGEVSYNTADQNSMASIIGLVVSVVLSLLGIIFLILVIYAGFSWMTAAGEEERVTKAKETLNRAVIGLIITVGSYAIWVFVSGYLL